MPAMYKVTLVSIDSEVNAGDNDQEIDILDAERFEGDQLYLYRCNNFCNMPPTSICYML